jgi:hypothetical protein
MTNGGFDMVDETLISRLADLVDDLPNPDDPYHGSEQYDNPALICLDTALSIRNNYQKSVLPRMRDFPKNHPDVTSLDSLKHLMDDVGLENFGEVWNFRAKHRIEMAYELCKWFIDYRDNNDFTDDLTAIRHWAANVDPTVKRPLDIKGIGLSALQHLRMIAGHPTVPLGEYLTISMEELLGEKVPLGDAVVIADGAAAQANVDPMRVARGLWTTYKGHRKR